MWLFRSSFAINSKSQILHRVLIFWHPSSSLIRRRSKGAKNFQILPPSCRSHYSMVLLGHLDGFGHPPTYEGTLHPHVPLSAHCSETQFNPNVPQLTSFLQIIISHIYISNFIDFLKYFTESFFKNGPFFDFWPILGRFCIFDPFLYFCGGDFI